MGVGFAIPSDTVRRVVNQIIRFGKVVKPTLGVAMVNDQSAAPVIGQGKGVIIRDVLPGSSAAQAGLRYSTTRTSPTLILRLPHTLC